MFVCFQVQVDFADGHDSIKVEGPPEEVAEACRKLREMIENLKNQVAYEEIRIKPAFHRHIIGKNGANSMFVFEHLLYDSN